MKQEGYVDQDNNVIVNDGSALKKSLIRIGIILVSIIVIIIVIFSFINKKKYDECNKIDERVESATTAYLTDNNLLPIIGGDSIKVDISTLISNNYLTDSDLTYKEEVCNSGSIKVTKYKDDYIYTLDLSGCGICSTDSRYKSWSKKELDKKPNEKRGIVDVIAYYNYYEKKLVNTAWTNYMPSSKVSTEETNGVLLPLDSTKLPKVPKVAEDVYYDVETTTYYSYRDLKYKFYKDNGGNYSGFYSLAPDGYPNRDTATLKYTDWSNWSADYPDTADYRSIETKTGYKWYYLDSQKEKVYYDNGGYYPVAPDDKYTEIDKSSTVKMYRYRDKVWRWYNGNKRTYSGYKTTIPKGYTAADYDLYQYTSWSNFSRDSKLNSSNSSYREEKTDTYYRYRANYYLYSDLIFKESVIKEVFENKTGMTIEEASNDENINLDISYKFLYRKRK